MFECRRQLKRLREWMAGTLDAAGLEALDRHAAVCPGCRKEWQGLQEVIMGIKQKPMTDPGPEFWDRYWDRLQARLASEGRLSLRAATPRRLFFDRRAFLRRLALPSAVAALVVVGIMIGRWSAHSLRPSAPSVSGVVQASGLEIRTDRYLDRSKRILLALVNDISADKDVFGLDLPGRKTASRALVRESADLRGDLSKAKKRRLERLVSDLQTILLQIANLKAEDGPDAVDIIRAGIEGRDVIFQINLARMRGASGSSAAPFAAATGAPARKSAF